MSDRATAFALAFDSEFKSQTAGLSPKEIPLFRALHRALVAAGTRLAVEEYHGTSYQVGFSGNGSYARVHARCELSDLLIIVFTRNPPAARITYLQAKSERRMFPSPCRHSFSANLEQWFLLRNRPPIAGFGNFAPPADLLSSAILPSVGSFGFFYRTHNGLYEIYYASAAQLQPPTTYSQRYGSLVPVGGCGVIIASGHLECVAACGSVPFAESLYRLEIGTPIDPSISRAASTRSWLTGNLRKIQQATPTIGGRREIVDELVSLLRAEDTPDHSPSGQLGAKNIIVIRSDYRPN